MKTLSNNYAFIDAQNLYLSLQRCGWKLDYFKEYKKRAPEGGLSAVTTK